MNFFQPSKVLIESKKSETTIDGNARNVCHRERTEIYEGHEIGMGWDSLVFITSSAGFRITCIPAMCHAAFMLFDSQKTHLLLRFPFLSHSALLIAPSNS